MSYKTFIPTLFVLLFATTEVFSNENDHKYRDNLAHEDFTIFDFVLENYAFISYDLLSGGGDFLDVLYRQAPEKSEAELYLLLSNLLITAQTIPEFTRSAVDILKAQES